MIELTIVKLRAKNVAGIMFLSNSLTATTSEKIESRRFKPSFESCARLKPLFEHSKRLTGNRLPAWRQHRFRSSRRLCFGADTLGDDLKQSVLAQQICRVVDCRKRKT